MPAKSKDDKQAQPIESSELASPNPAKAVNDVNVSKAKPERLEVKEPAQAAKAPSGQSSKRATPPNKQLKIDTPPNDPDEVSQQSAQNQVET